QQLEQRILLGMVRAGRIAGGRADATVFFADQLLVAQLLIRRIAPVLPAYLLVQPLGAGLGQAVGQRLDHDRVVVVTGLLVGLGLLLVADVCGGDEAAHIVGQGSVSRGDVVCYGVVGLAVGLDCLLAKVMQAIERLAVVVEKLNIMMIHLIGRPETEYRAGA